MQWPSTLVYGLRDAADHPLRHGLGVGPQLGVDTGDDDVELLEHRGRLVEPAVLEDVDLDAGQQAEVVALGLVAALMPATTSSCSASRSAVSPLATVSRGEWSVSAR